MKTINCVFAIIIIEFIFGCSNNTITPPTLNNTEIQDIIMYTDYHSIPLFTDSLTVQKINMDKNTLQLVVSYGGGCKSHQFALYGFAGFLKSLPPQADLFLSHNGNGDPCKALIIQELNFNLENLLTACKQQFGTGQIMLRINIPNTTEPIRPLIPVSF